MPRYMILKPVFVRANGEPSARLHPAGSEIVFDGVPSAVMAALDVKAREAKRKTADGRHPDAVRHAQQTERILRAKLSRSLARRLADAEAKMDRQEAARAAS